MHTLYPPRQVMDLVVGRRIFNACWFSASLGISILQMRLLAQGWHLTQHALVPACMMSLWTLAALIGTRLPNTSRVWGFTTLACALLWLGAPSVVMWHLPASLVPPSLLTIAALALLAALLGASSSAWLAGQRDWLAAGERTTLVRSLVGLTVGLVVVWMLPVWSGLLALVCGVPLLVLDAVSCGRAPLPVQTRVEAALIRRDWRGEQQPPLQLEQRRLGGSWWWEWLVERSRSSRGYLPLSLLASSIAVILGSVWGAVPTPFAAGLAATNALEKLGWLLGGQLIVVLLGACLLQVAAREVICFPDRLVPPSWQARARLLVRLAPVGMAAGLAALGLPFLQAPWWLAASLAGYTLASAVWGLMLPRVRPALTTQVEAERHLRLGKGRALPTALHLAHASAREARVTRLLATVEGVFIAAITPLFGWLIDTRGSVDPLLVSVGLGFLAALLAAMAMAILVPARRRTRSPRRVASSVNRYRAHPVSSHQVRPAW